MRKKNIISHALQSNKYVIMTNQVRSVLIRYIDKLSKISKKFADCHFIL